MKITIIACCLLNIPILLAPEAAADEEVKSDDEATRELKVLYQDAGWVLAGNYVKSYKYHGDMPAPLKTTSSSGKLILFLKEKAGTDKDVLGAIPWSATIEKELPTSK